MKYSEYVWLSFSTADQQKAEALHGYLNAHDIDTRMVSFDALAEDMNERDADRLARGCGCCVLILTDSPQQSAGMAETIRRARQYRKPLIPLSAAELRVSGPEEIRGLLPAGCTEDIVVMGEYYYWEDGSTKPIEWIVAAEDDEKQLLVSRYVIDVVNYHTDGQILSWRDCTLRTWLNTEFITRAFSPSEAERFLTSRRTKTKNIFYGMEDDPDCTDKVFLLSVEEAKQYLRTTDRIGSRPTPYAEEKGVFTQEYGLWWIRTPGEKFGQQAYVHAAGGITYDGCYQQRGQVGIRPAVWVRKQE